MTRIRFAALSLALGLLVALSLPLAPGASSAQQPEPGTSEVTQRTINVTGTGQVTAIPDAAVVRLGVETRAPQAAEALDQNSEQMQALLDAFGQAGIADEDIRTEMVQLYPIYEQPQPDPAASQSPTQTVELVAYQATNIVEVRTEDLEGLGALLDSAVDVGGNRIESIRFELSDPSAAVDQARQAAWEDASHKAGQLAELAGVQLGEVLTIAELSRTPQPFYREGVAADVAVPIEPGTQTVALDIQVTWLIAEEATTP